MLNKLEKNILYTLICLVVLITPLSIIGKDYRKWLLTFFINSYVNIFVASALASKGYLKYPVRLLPTFYKSSIIYDYFLCSTLTTLFCRTTIKDNWKRALWKVWLFALPQGLLEGVLERKTKLIKYGKGWTVFHSLLTISSAKLTIRSVMVLLDIIDQKTCNTN
ncbi:hypothetical protein BKP37_15665 [Anaerobacillus alkalilacustris]|uniref:Uncharacterized protein n=1 Tax=Anaerobacillus alkalilacustris TaxID=393763 RepID=A0A1S2LJ41_9BACI|nr:CBO0543 family protein [Anaerobacillus alkalilacustris]OIJ11475.1 hypothetical protein BKP37_15665 [Anaerobacillus alkalilacustris]